MKPQQRVRELLAATGKIEIRPPDREASIRFDAYFPRFLEGLQALNYPTERSAHHRQSDLLLVAMAEQFHQRTETNTPRVQAALARLRAGAKIIRIFHQPDTLMGLNIAGLLDLADRASEVLAGGTGQRPVAVFILLDYDVAGDQRFRAPYLPGRLHFGLTHLSGAVPTKARRRIACATPPPSVAQVDSWMHLFNEAAMSWADLLRRAGEPILTPSEIQDRLSAVAKAIAHAYRSMPSLTLANAAAASWMANIAWGLDTVFVPSSWLLGHSHGDMINILRNGMDWSERATQGINQALTSLGGAPLAKQIDLHTRGVWRVCPQCLNRIPMRVVPESDRTIGSWLCQSCHESGLEIIDEHAIISTPLGEVPRIVPAVFVCDLLESISYGLDIGVNYAGGVEHALWSQVAAVTHGLPLSFQYFWDPNDLIEKRIVQAAIQSMRRHAHSQDEQEQVLSDSFQRGRFPALFFWALYGRKYLRDSVLRSASSLLRSSSTLT